MNRSALKSLLILVAGVLACVPSTSGAYEFYTTGGDDPQPLRWFTGRPAYNWTLSTVEPQDAPWESIQGLVDEAFDGWVTTACGVVPEFTFAGTSEATASTLPTSLSQEPDNLVVFIRTRAQWTQSGNQSSWLAITKIASDNRTGEIIDADIEVNDGMYTFHYGEDAPPSGQIDFRAMIVHEVGHFFGMDHSAVTTATMFATYSGDPVGARTLDPDDEAGVCALYADAPEWVDRTPPEPPPSNGGGGCSMSSEGAGLASLGVVLLLGLRRRRAMG